MTEFNHLHNHSEYSLLDGMSTPEEIIDVAKRHGQESIALTDHGNMGGTLRLQEAAAKAGVKAIHGCEFYYVPSLVADTDDKKAERFHLILLAKNDDGLKKLWKLQEKSWTTGFYYKPRIEWDDLAFLAGDVICLSGCMASVLCRLLSAGEENKAWKTVGQFHHLFRSDYYLELQPWNDEGLNDKLIDLATAHNIMAVGTIDCHYSNHSDKSIEETLLMMNQIPSLNAGDSRFAKEHAHEISKMPVIDKINHLYPNRFLRFDHHDNYIMSGDEVKAAFENVGVYEDVYTASLEIADKCNAAIPMGRSLLPVFNKKIDSTEYLREIAELGLQELGHSDNPIYVERLNHELEVIERLNFSNYFLIVWDICAFADRNGIARGAGRGSVAGSLLAYCLGITKVDSIKYDLLFSRFINEDRVSWPDIDMDFEDKRRWEVFEYIRTRWGIENTASISTYGEFKPKSVIKDAARVFQVPYDRMNKLTPKFNDLSDLKHIPEGRKFLEDYPYILPIAERLENRVRNAGAHAAGVVISSEPLHKVLPLETRNDANSDNRVKVTAFSMDEVEKVGLIKFDILGVKALAVVNDCINKIKERHDIDVSSVSNECDDVDVLGALNSDSMVGIFQAEGAGYKNLVADMGIDSFNDLVASNALVRPGAKVAYGDTYIACKQGKQKVKYFHEVCEPFLKETYGTLVYQEQTMQLAQVLAGFSATEADTLRKIIGKKRDAKEFQPFHDKWMEGCSRYVSAKEAQKIWDSIELMSNYSFNKSHAVAYSMLTYQCMWLKYYYPTEFIWACLTNETKNEDVSGFLSEANRLGVSVLPPDINDSDSTFGLHGDSVRFGLCNVMGCGPSAIEEILAKRPFSSFEEFQGKCLKSKVRKNVVENLEKIGAFRNIGHDPGYDYEKYYLPILNWTHYAEQDKSYQSILSKCGDVEDNNGYHFVRGMVKSTTRKPHYFRVEIEDSSGTVSVFCDDKQAAIKKKDYLLALVGNKSLVAYCDANAEDDPLKDFIEEVEAKDLPIDPEIWPEGDKIVVKLISARTFKTKKTGATMGNIVAFNPVSGGYEKLVAFPDMYKRITPILEKWKWVVVRLGDKPGVIDGIIGVEDYIKLKAGK